jgi:eukaryotic-like serine/threonine-protein kinase
MSIKAASRVFRKRYHRLSSSRTGRLRFAVLQLQDYRTIYNDETSQSQILEAELKTGDIVAGRYRIEIMLGAGGMGVVYRAFDEQLGILVALKLLRPELAVRKPSFERFRQELLLARKVSSPHVVRIHDLVADGDRRFISMDFVPGRSLEQSLDERGALSQSEALAIAHQIALGLVAAHESGVVHRDLKPANILLRDDGHACISDFGVARSTGALRVTGTGVMVGTPDYVSPEQARGADVGPRSDLYALGLIIYEMLSGRRAFEDSTPAESLALRQFRGPKPLRQLKPEVSPWLESLVARLLEPNPMRRFRDAAEVIAAIEAQKVPRVWPRSIWIAVGICIVAMAVVLWWVMAPRNTTPITQVATGTNAGQILPAASSTSGPEPSEPAPLELVVLPLQSAAADSDLASAYTQLIAYKLQASGLASVDQTRVRAALRRLGYDSVSAVEHQQRVLTELGARRLLIGQLQRGSTGLRLRLRIEEAGATAAARVISTPEVSIAAMPPSVLGVLTELKLLDAKDNVGSLLPINEKALRAYGRALNAQKDDDALQGYAQAIAEEPQFVVAWWSYLLMARRSMPNLALMQQTAQAKEAIRGVRGRDAERVQALLALIEGNPKAAVERFAALVKRAPFDHQTRLHYAEALQADDNAKAAEQELMQLTKSDPQNAQAWLLLGQNAIRAGEAQRAVDDYLTRARVLFTRLEDQRGHADTLNALGSGFDLLGQTKPAVDHFTQAAALREAQGNLRGAISSRRNLAWAYAVSGDTLAADADIAQARKHALVLEDSALLADVANDAGLIAEERGDFRGALPHFREALKLRESMGEALAAAQAALNLGFALLQTGVFADARAHLQQAERVYSAANDRVGIVHSLQPLAAVDIAMGDYVSAQTRLERALHMATEVNLAEERAILHAELAEVARQRGKLGEALAQSRRALVLFQQLEDARGLAQARLRVSAVYRDLQLWDAAELALQPFDKVAPNSIEQKALLSVLRGEIALGRGNWKGAIRHAQAALKHIAASHSFPAEIQARTLLIHALARSDKPNAVRELTKLDIALASYPAHALQFERALAAIAALPASDAAESYLAASKIFGAKGVFGRSYLLHQAGADVLSDPAQAKSAKSLAEQSFALLRDSQAARSAVDNSAPLATDQDSTHQVATAKERQ